MEHIDTECLTPDDAGIVRVVEVWKNGGLVAFPTETVYGLGADACNNRAVARIFSAKGRPQFNPLIIHVESLESAQHYADFGQQALDLAQAFWPGPLSLVVPLRKDNSLSDLVSAGLDTVAVRVPENPLARRLLAAFGGAIAAPSANPSGGISPTTADHVMDGLGGRIDAVVNGGTCNVGLESTILLPDCGRPPLLRPGGLPAEAIEAALGIPLARPDDPERPLSPGQMASHYAPSVQVRMNADVAEEGEIWLGFGPDLPGTALNLSVSGDLMEAAANLFGMLHKMDELAKGKGVNKIAVAPVPEHGLGVAINDRIKRASAPR